MKRKTAFITGINGQTGAFLAKLLLEKDYEVWGILKRNSVAETQSTRLNDMGIFSQLKLEYGDMLDMSSLIRVIQLAKLDEVYNLAAQSHVRISFIQPIYTTQTIVLGILNLLEAIKLIKPQIKLYQASSSETYGNSVDNDGFQRETTPMHPTSPYGCAKLYAYHIVRHYRRAYNMFASNGILFNHESPIRGTNFVTNKVVKEAVRIKKGFSKQLKLGNLDVARDWGHAKDYAKVIWQILQHDKPDDFVCASGISHTVRELCEYVFKKLDLDYKDWVSLDTKQIRPEDINILKGDATKAKTKLGWRPTYTFETLLDEMIDYWLEKKDYELIR